MPSKPSAKKKAPLQAHKAHKALERAPAPPPEPPKPKTVEERTAYLEARLQQAGPAVQALYRDNLDLSWIAHDSALEGVVYTIQELKAAVDPTATFVGDSSLQPVVEEVRRHREALNFVREYAVKRKQPLTLDVIKKIYVTLHPEEGDVKTVKYRKDIPQHRLYFHEYSPPDKITYKMRQIVDWINDPETHRTRNGIRIAARAHYDIVRVFPFAQDSGKVARLFMNLMLLRSGYPPAIVHSTERQRYYEALKGSSATMNTIVQDAIENSLASIEKLLDTVEGKPVAD
jgi:Fic family protein